MAIRSLSFWAQRRSNTQSPRHSERSEESHISPDFNPFEILPSKARQNDKELTEKIKNYQELHNINTFDEAVKRLCDEALEIEKFAIGAILNALEIRKTKKCGKSEVFTFTA